MWGASNDEKQKPTQSLIHGGCSLKAEPEFTPSPKPLVRPAPPSSPRGQAATRTEGSPAGAKWPGGAHARSGSTVWTHTPR